MKILLAASEVAPIIKIGGLGDVVGSLPLALEKIGVDVDVIVPFYPIAKTEGLKIYKGIDLEIPFGGKTEVVTVYKTKLTDSDVDVILLQNANYFRLGGKSAFADDISETEMFVFFDRAVVEFIKSKYNTYDLIHCNDWHTGLITHLLTDEIGKTRPATLLTVHNLSYQGVGDEDLLQDVGIVPGAHRLIDWDIQDSDVNLMLHGVTSTDFVSTVSPTYAKEILFKDIGGTLAEVMQSRVGRIEGILNGINYQQFPRSYDLENWKEAKAEMKSKIADEFALDPNKPIFGFISRLDPNQKGLDVLYESIEHIVESDAQLLLLGTGAKDWESKLEKLAQDPKYKENVSINIKFDVKMAERIYQGSDYLLVPSRFEPCGLIQMISMHYGTPPVVHATGGLKDTVIDGQNGFTYKLHSSKDLNDAITRSLEIFGTKEYDKIVQNAMLADFSWDESAKKYKELYEKVIDIRKRDMNFVNARGEEENG